MNKQDPILLNVLKTTGLKEKEASVYLALLELRAANISAIAKRTGLKRPVLYVIIEDLITKGYANEIPNLKIRAFRAMEPTAIEAHLKNTTKNFTEMLPIFKTLANLGSKKPRILYYDSLAGIEKVLEEINRQDQALFISSFSPFKYHFPEMIKQWLNSYRKGYMKLSSRTLIPDNPADLAIAKSFEHATKKAPIRVLKNMKSCAMDLTVFGNKIAITTFDEQPVMVVLESEAIPQFMTPLFDLLWENAKEIK